MGWGVTKWESEGWNTINIASSNESRVHVRTLIQVWVRVPYTGYSKHEFACIPISVIHNKYDCASCLEIRAVFVYSSSFSPWKQQKRTPQSFDVNIYVIIHVTWHCLQYSAPLLTCKTHAWTRTRINVKMALQCQYIVLLQWRIVYGAVWYLLVL